MAASIVRRINFYEIFVIGGGEYSCRDYMVHVFNKLSQAINEGARFVDMPMSTGDYMHMRIGNITEINERARKIYGKARLIKFNEFPETFRVSDKNERALGDEAAPDEGVTEETHFVIDLGYKDPIIAVETTQGGPRVTQIMSYLESWINRTSARRGVIELETKFVIGRTAMQLLQALKECAYITIKVKKENIGIISDFNKELGTALESSQKIGDTDYVDLNLGYNFRTARNARPKTESLINKLFQFVRINEESDNQFFSNFEKFQIKFQEGDQRLQMFDLLADKTSVEVTTERKSDRSKLLNSMKLYEAILIEIGRNFGHFTQSASSLAKQIPVPTFVV